MNQLTLKRAFVIGLGLTLGWSVGFLIEQLFSYLVVTPLLKLFLF
jgi:hypothetical protein